MDIEGFQILLTSLSDYKGIQDEEFKFAAHEDSQVGVQDLGIDNYKHSDINLELDLADTYPENGQNGTNHAKVDHHLIDKINGSHYMNNEDLSTEACSSSEKNQHNEFIEECLDQFNNQFTDDEELRAKAPSFEENPKEKLLAFQNDRLEPELERLSKIKPESKNGAGNLREKVFKSIAQLLGDRCAGNEDHKTIRVNYCRLAHEDRLRLEYLYNFFNELDSEWLKKLAEFVSEYQQNFQKIWKNHKTWKKLDELCGSCDGGMILYYIIQKFFSEDAKIDFNAWLISFHGDDGTKAYIYKELQNDFYKKVTCSHKIQYPNC